MYGIAMDARMHGCVRGSGLMDGGTDGLTERWMAGWMDGWIYARVDVSAHICTVILNACIAVHI